MDKLAQEQEARAVESALRGDPICSCCKKYFEAWVKKRCHKAWKGKCKPCILDHGAGLSGSSCHQGRFYPAQQPYDTLARRENFVEYLERDE